METAINGNKKLTVVLGASGNPERYSFLAVSKLKAHGHPVVAIGNREAQIAGTPVITEHPALEQVDTVTLYLNPQRQEAYYDYILQLHPKRIIFNPGTENPKLEQLAIDNGIKPMEACTLVLLSTGQY
ncbi:CoA-binding protein [Chitinophaga agrisoli]|uniref:CoA-binding protein n=1 Tax=Chitinophaga agrisoli TaxID=2607653 RepID=A0A5B2VPL6_9BACT|nr:CoA-binding protein [Chitinophaga agrisoli]KAA2240650.1 CoA-binding protein [Chitinophaga agrisoli]